MSAGERLLPPLFLILTFVTGVVDALSYLRLGHVFVANMTGNVVFLGFGLAGAGGISVWASLLALVAFLLGGVIGGRIAGAPAVDLRAAIGTQVLFVGAALIVVASDGDSPGRSVRHTLIALLAVAMGIQNAAARRLAVRDLTTTVLTLTLTGIASDSRLAGGEGAPIGRRGLAVAAMLLGAVAGGLLVLDVSDAAALALAAGLLVLVAIALVEPLRSRLAGS